MKYEEIKKRLVKESVIVGGVLLVLAGANYYLMSVFDDNERNSKLLETQANTIVASMNTLKNKFTAVQKNADLYQEVLRKSASDGLTVSRDAIRTHFDQFKSRYNLNGLHLSMEAPQDMTGPKYKLSTSVMNASHVKITFGALNDEDVYNLLQAMPRELPGAIKCTHFTLTRNGNPTADTLKTVRETGQAQMVDGNIEFSWLGIKSAEAPAPNPNDPLAGVRK